MRTLAQPLQRGKVAGEGDKEQEAHLELDQLEDFGHDVSPGIDWAPRGAARLAAALSRSKPNATGAPDQSDLAGPSRMG